MNKVITLILMMLLLNCGNAIAQQSADELRLLEQLRIEQGSGEFSQQKYFKFLSLPIRSSGVFKVNPNAALWHTQQPVFSQVLFADDNIYRRLALNGPYQVLVQNSELGSVLGAIFKAEISTNDWSISMVEKQPCIKLIPKNPSLIAIFSRVSLCLKQQQRVITMWDKHDNKTIITMTLLANQLSQQDVDALELPH